MAMGAGRSLYAQAQQRAHAVRVAEVKEVTSGLDSTKAFVPQFEMLSVHVYMTLYRLRVEKGTKGEGAIATAMQCLFDIFWADVRRRMLIEERGMSLLASGKWVKECEKMFFGMAVAFDEAWDDEAKFSECISRNITCLKGDSVKVERFRRYMLRERMRLNKIPIEKIWQGDCLYWDDNYSIVS